MPRLRRTDLRARGAGENTKLFACLRHAPAKDAPCADSTNWRGAAGHTIRLNCVACQHGLSTGRHFATLDEFWTFWDAHSSADYEDVMTPVEVEMKLFAKDLLSQVRAQARRQGVSPETLVNLWLQERLYAAA